MARDFGILLDAPGDPAQRIPLAKLGSYSDKRYGEFAITESDVQDWQRNLSQLPGGRALIDEDHLADKPSPFRRTEASGWITGIELEGTQAYAAVEWTPKGEDAIREKRFLFTSPTFGEYTNETGDVFENTLTGAALTNKPFLNMPMVTLASDASIQRALEQDPASQLFQLALDGLLGEEAQTIALEAADDDRQFLLDELSSKARNDLSDSDFALPGRRYPIHDLSHARNALARAAQHGSPDEQGKVKAAVYRRYPELKPSASKKQMAADSRAQTMKLDADILKGLGITDEGEIAKLIALSEAEDTDAKMLLEAIEAAKPAPAEPKTLDQLAEEKGVVVLSQEDHEALKAKADSAPEPEPTKTLEERAAEAGLTVVDPATLTALEADRTKVTALESAVAHLQEDAERSKKELAEANFETAYDAAEREGKAVPAQKEQFEKFFTLDQEGTLKMLSEAPVLVNTERKGRNIDPRGDSAPDGVDPARHELEGQIEAYMQEHDCNWMTALDAVSGVKIAGMS